MALLWNAGFERQMLLTNPDPATNSVTVGRADLGLNHIDPLAVSRQQLEFVFPSASPPPSSSLGNADVNTGKRSSSASGAATTTSSTATTAFSVRNVGACDLLLVRPVFNEHAASQPFVAVKSEPSSDGGNGSWTRLELEDGATVLFRFMSGKTTTTMKSSSGDDSAAVMMTTATTTPTPPAVPLEHHDIFLLLPPELLRQEQQLVLQNTNNDKSSSSNGRKSKNQTTTTLVDAAVNALVVRRLFSDSYPNALVARGMQWIFLSVVAAATGSPRGQEDSNGFTTMLSQQTTRQQPPPQQQQQQQQQSTTTRTTSISWATAFLSREASGRLSVDGIAHQQQQQQPQAPALTRRTSSGSTTLYSGRDSLLVRRASTGTTAAGAGGASQMSGVVSVSQHFGASSSAIKAIALARVMSGGSSSSSNANTNNNNRASNSNATRRQREEEIVEGSSSAATSSVRVHRVGSGTENSSSVPVRSGTVSSSGASSGLARKTGSSVLSDTTNSTKQRHSSSLQEDNRLSAVLSPASSPEKVAAKAKAQRQHEHMFAAPVGGGGTSKFPAVIKTANNNSLNNNDSYDFEEPEEPILIGTSNGAVGGTLPKANNRDSQGSCGAGMLSSVNCDGVVSSGGNVAVNFEDSVLDALDNIEQLEEGALIPPPQQQGRTTTTAASSDRASSSRGHTLGSSQNTVGGGGSASKNKRGGGKSRRGSTAAGVQAADFSSTLPDAGGGNNNNNIGGGDCRNYVDSSQMAFYDHGRFVDQQQPMSDEYTSVEGSKSRASSRTGPKLRR